MQNNAKSRKNKKTILLSLLFALTFLFVGIISLPRYGVNWDEPIHFGRGQAILHFFLTGEKDYKNFRESPPNRQSFYQSDGYTFEYLESSFKKNSGIVIGAGHPVLSDLLASVTNRVVYGSLGLLGDIESYHLYSVFLSAVLVGCIVYFTATFYGFFPAVVAGLSLLLYPLFLGESKFNIKDPPESVFYALTAITFFLGIVRNKWMWILISSIFAGLAFATKLNIIFLSLSLAVWLFLYWRSLLRKHPLKILIRRHRQVILLLVVFPIIPLFSYFVSWPILWEDPVNRFLYNLSYYKKVGLAVSPDPQFSVIGVNTYALQWIVFITPLVTLILSSAGVLWTLLFGFKEKHKLSLFVLLWFAIPILRVMLPGTEIYGGVRHIMEYIPAMAILSGIGANYIANLAKQFNNSTIQQLSQRKPPIVQVLILLSFIPITVKIFSLFPNESIYFNPLIGGLKGAQEKDIPGWGNSLGSTYRQGVDWLNKHAEKNAKVVFVYELGSNIPYTLLRKDIEHNNQLRSGLERRGEYVIGVTHDATHQDAFHRKYLEEFLIPVYELSVDGVPVLKIWKNDFIHSKSQYQKDQVEENDVVVEEEGDNTIINLKTVWKVTRVIVTYPLDNCTIPTSGHFEHSIRGEVWTREVGDFTSFTLSARTKTNPAPGVLQFWFAGERAQYIKLVNYDKNSCLLKNSIAVKVFHI